MTKIDIHLFKDNKLTAIQDHIETWRVDELKPFFQFQESIGRTWSYVKSEEVKEDEKS